MGNPTDASARIERYTMRGRSKRAQEDVLETREQETRSRTQEEKEMKKLIATLLALFAIVTAVGAGPAPSAHASDNGAGSPPPACVNWGCPPPQ